MTIPSDRDSNPANHSKKIDRLFAVKILFYRLIRFVDTFDRYYSILIILVRQVHNFDRYFQCNVSILFKDIIRSISIILVRYIDSFNRYFRYEMSILFYQLILFDIDVFGLADRSVLSISVESMN